MPGWIDSTGPTIAPASPASAAPRAKMKLVSQPMFTPSADTMLRLLAPARISMPTRVRSISTCSPKATASPATMIAPRYDG